MTFRHLTIFIRVCDEKVMTRAAEKLHMTQPSVSQAVQELEAHYGVQLFERLGRRLFLTAAGEKLLTYARHIVNLNAQTEEEMRQFGSVYRVRLGASVTIGECVLIGLLCRLRERQPRSRVVSAIHNTSVLEKMVLEDEIDIALVEGRVHSEYLTEIPFMEDELIFIAAPAHPLAGMRSSELAVLEDADFIVREKGSGTRLLFEQVMQETGVAYRIVGTYNNAETIKKAVAAGLGISVISKLAVRDELADGRLCRLPLQGLQFFRQFRLIYHRNKYLSAEIKDVIALCRAMAMTENPPSAHEENEVGNAFV